MGEVVPRYSLWAEDCVRLTWESEPTLPGSGPNGEFVFGIFRGDGNCEPLPPMTNLLEEVKKSLSRHPNTNFTELASPAGWKTCQSVIAKLMAVDGGDDDDID